MFRPSHPQQKTPVYLSTYNTTIEPLSDHDLPTLLPSCASEAFSVSLTIINPNYTPISNPQHRPAPLSNRQVVQANLAMPKTLLLTSPFHLQPSSPTMQAPHLIPTSQASPPLPQHPPFNDPMGMRPSRHLSPPPVPPPTALDPSPMPQRPNIDPFYQASSRDINVPSGARAAPFVPLTKSRSTSPR